MKTLEKNKLKNKLVVITGPTCSGKTELSLKLASSLSTEIISADSMQVYKGFDIGTAKPEKGILSSIKHHLINIVEANHDFDAWKYMTLARDVINETKLKFLIVSGGTQLYIKSLLEGLTAQASKDIDFRDSMNNQIHEKGIFYLYEQLKKVDPVSAEKISSNDKQRIIRYLEIDYLSKQNKGEPLNLDNKGEIQNCDYIKVGLMIPKSELDLLINKRVDEMVDKGLFNEVEDLAKLYNKDLKPFQSIGYKEAIMYISGDLKKNEAINLIKTKTRQFAKRQNTWLRKDNKMIWFSGADELLDFSRKFLIS